MKTTSNAETKTICSTRRDVIYLPPLSLERLVKY